MKKEHDLKIRTKNFCIECIKLTEKLPKIYLANHIKGQLVRSASSVAANYRAAILAHSKAAFTSKISIVIEEADESVFWFELIYEFNLIKNNNWEKIKKEGQELVAIFITSRKKLQIRK